MIQIARAAAVALADRPARLARIETAKISRRVLPGQCIQVEARREAPNAPEPGWKIKARLSDGPAAVATILMKLEPEP